MKIYFCYRYLYQQELRRMDVVYDDGDVTVTAGDKSYSLTLVGDTLEGAGTLAAKHREAIARSLNFEIQEGGV
jgi:hypothetical protein